MTNELSILNLKADPKLDLMLFEPPGGDESGQWGQWMMCFTLWLDQKRRRSGGENTVTTYATAFKQCFSPQVDVSGLVVWQPVAPWEMNSRMAMSWTAFLTQMGKEIRDKRTGKQIERVPLSRSSINLKLTALASFYRFAINYGIWPPDRGNPFTTVERGQIDLYSRATYPTYDDAMLMLKVINTECLSGKRDMALLYTVLTTCRRSSEVRNLKWGDLTKVKDGWEFKYRYKGGKIKRAVLGNMAYELICTYLKADGRLSEMGKDDYIFVAIDEDRVKRMRPGAVVNPNQPISNSLINRILKKYAARVNRHAGREVIDLAKAHVHGLRHAGLRQRVVELKAAGKLDYEEIMNIAGHSDLRTTFIYVKTVGEDREDHSLAAAEAAFMPKGGKARRARKPAGEQIALLTPEQEEIQRLKARLAELEKQGR